MDLVSIPASQANVERAFSPCGHLCNRKRNKASAAIGGAYQGLGGLSPPKFFALHVSGIFRFTYYFTALNALPAMTTLLRNFMFSLP